MGGLEFRAAWSRRVEGRYGRATVFWIDLDTLIEIKSRIDDPRHDNRKEGTGWRGARG